ncbi:carbonic anhydrase [Aureimonas sp. AU12]|uniref:carbonic anhydrase n=1 Tax=Aureimonas sp. AU12 TaxID=1638161 RepID=UPI000784C004|nr:carbonic anhydrase [Aureimonas sp. AU12]
MASSFSRRHFLGCACLGAASLAAAASAGLAGSAFAATAVAGGDVVPSVGGRTVLTADEALALLKKGNAEFISDAPIHAAIGRERRIEIAREQHPFAVLVACSDSRVSPELLFGRGLGELFIVRNAGNTLDTVALGSLEYAVEHLGTPLVLVMGHQRCGAVSAAVSVVRDNKMFDGAIGQMIEPIIPAVLAVRDQPGDLVDNAVRENVRRVVHNLRNASEPLLARPIAAGQVRIVGAEYSLDDGSVNFFDEA